MKYKHYAPAATLTLLCGSREDYAARVNEYYETLQRAGEEDGFYAMCFDEDVSLLEAPTISYGVAYDYPSQAQNLFDVLRQLDKLQATEVYVPAPEPEEDFDEPDPYEDGDPWDEDGENGGDENGEPEE